jgi:hypothetical protein
VDGRLAQAWPTAKQDKNRLVLFILSFIVAVIAGTMTHGLDVQMILLPLCLSLPLSFLTRPQHLHSKPLRRVHAFCAFVKGVEE